MPCGRCLGLGKVPIPDGLIDALTELRGGPRTVADVWARISPTTARTAVNNRLEDLRRLGLVTRRRVGKVWVYRIAEGS